MDARAPLLELPARRIDAHGGAHVDFRAVLALAGPFMLNSAVQAVLNLTDTWFIGQISTQAMAAIGAVYWLVLVFVLLLGGVGIAVQTLVAQAYGGRRNACAAQAAWTAQWAALLTVPLFLGVAYIGPWLLAPFDLDAATERLALEFWRPRLGGAPLGVALWAALGFFNGIGRPKVTLSITLLVAVLNAVLNQIFIFEWSWGIAGSAWAINVAQTTGLALSRSATWGSSASCSPPPEHGSCRGSSIRSIRRPSRSSRWDASSSGSLRATRSSTA